MAITMTVRGTLPGDQWYEGRCACCKSEYRAQRKDLDSTDHQRDGTMFHIECQLGGCNYLVYFKPESKF